MNRRNGIGNLALFALGFGNIVGVGWLVLVGGWLQVGGPAGAAIAFAVGALLITVIALCYAELAAMYPQTGGEVVYAYRIFGTQTGYAVGWFLLLSYVNVIAFEAVSMGWLLAALFPGIGGPEMYVALGNPVRLGDLVAGLGGMALLGWLNARGTVAASRFQSLCTWLLILMAVAFVAAALRFGHAENLLPLFGASDTSSIAGFVSVLVATPFMLTGFNVIVQALDERAAWDRFKSLGKVMGCSILGAGIFYVAVIVASAVSLPRVDLLAHELPAAAALGEALRSDWAARLVLVTALMGLVTTWNSVMFAGARVAWMMSRARFLPVWLFAGCDDADAPRRGLLMVCAIAAIPTLGGRGMVLPIVSANSAITAVLFLIVCAACARLRMRHPTQARPYRVPGGIATIAVAALVSIVLLVLAVQESFGGPHGIPAQWIVLATWSLLGVGLWRATVASRRSISESARHLAVTGVPASVSE